MIFSLNIYSCGVQLLSYLDSNNSEIYDDKNLKYQVFDTCDTK